MIGSARDLVRYFPGLTGQDLRQFDQLAALVEHWNSKINLVSRTDIDNLFEHHILHSLAIAKFIRFTSGTTVMDLGTGGGFPGIPLAIIFPEVSFTLVDSIAKKIRVVKDIAEKLNLSNVEAVVTRAESLPEQFDYVVSRAAAPLSDLVKWSEGRILKKQQNAIPNGIICLKGGDLADELKPFRRFAEVIPLSDYFDEAFFETKKLVFLPR